MENIIFQHSTLKTLVIQPAVFAGEFNHKKRMTINVMHRLVAQWASSSAPTSTQKEVHGGS